MTLKFMQAPCQTAPRQWYAPGLAVSSLSLSSEREHPPRGSRVHGEHSGGSVTCYHLLGYRYSPCDAFLRSPRLGSALSLLVSMTNDADPESQGPGQKSSESPASSYSVAVAVCCVILLAFQRVGPAIVMSSGRTGWATPLLLLCQTCDC
jgi:hypothetical protein